MDLRRHEEAGQGREGGKGTTSYNGPTVHWGLEIALLVYIKKPDLAFLALHGIGQGTLLLSRNTLFE